MSNQWFMYRRQKKFGPFTTERLKELATNGNIQPDDLIGREEGNSKPAREIEGLFSTQPEMILASVEGPREPPHDANGKLAERPPADQQLEIARLSLQHLENMDRMLTFIYNVVLIQVIGGGIIVAVMVLAWLSKQH